MKIDKRIKEVLFTHEDILKKTYEFGKKIDNYYQGKSTPIFLGVLKGCVLFYAHLLMNTTIESHTEFISISSYKDATSPSEVEVLMNLRISVKGRNILIIEDIIDTGGTLKKVKEILLNQGAKEIKIITLVNKPSNRKNNLKPDWTLFEVPNYFICGWGFDYNEEMRNLPYVGILKKEYYTKKTK